MEPRFKLRQFDSSLNILNCSSNSFPSLLHKLIFPLLWIILISLQAYCNHLYLLKINLSVPLQQKFLKMSSVVNVCIWFPSILSWSHSSQTLVLTTSLKLLLSKSPMTSLLTQRSNLSSHLIWPFNSFVRQTILLASRTSDLVFFLYLWLFQFPFADSFLSPQLLDIRILDYFSVLSIVTPSVVPSCLVSLNTMYTLLNPKFIPTVQISLLDSRFVCPTALLYLLYI